MLLQLQGSCRYRKRPDNYDGRVSQRKHKPDSYWALALLHELASHVINGRDVVCIHGVAKPKTVSEKCGAQQHRIMLKSDHRPRPCRHIENSQNAVNGHDLAFDVLRSVVQQSF